MLSELKVRLISVYSILLMTLTHISCCYYLFISLQFNSNCIIEKSVAKIMVPKEGIKFGRSGSCRLSWRCFLTAHHQLVSHQLLSQQQSCCIHNMVLGKIYLVSHLSFNANQFLKFLQKFFPHINLHVCRNISNCSLMELVVIRLQFKTQLFEYLTIEDIKWSLCCQEFYKK